MAGITWKENLESYLTNPRSKIAVTVDYDSYKIIKAILKRMPRKVNDDFSFTNKAVGVFRNNYAYKLVEDTMKILIDAGIPQHIRKIVHELFRNIVKDTESKVKVLNVDDLKAGFVTWLVTCCIAIIVFLMELFWFYGIQSSIGFFCFSKILRRLTRKFY